MTGPATKSPPYEAAADSPLRAGGGGTGSRRERAPLLHFTLNVNPLGCPAGGIEAARVAPSGANRYPAWQLAGLRRQLSGQHGVPADGVLFGCGLDEVIKLVASARTNEGDSVVVHVPTFPRYELDCVARGAVVHAVRSDPVGRTDVDELASSFFGITVSSPLT